MSRSSICNLIRAAHAASDENWLDACWGPGDAEDTVAGIEDETLKQDLAELKEERKLLQVEYDIRTVQKELKWRERRRKWQRETAEEQAAAKAKTEPKKPSLATDNGQTIQ